MVPSMKHRRALLGAMERIAHVSMNDRRTEPNPGRRKSAGNPPTWQNKTNMSGNLR